MSRLYLALFWLAALIALGASIQYECFVNRFTHSSRPFLNGIGYSQYSQNPKDISANYKYTVAEPELTTVNKSNGGPTDKKESAKSRDDARYKLENRQTKAEEQMSKWTLIAAITALIGVPFLALTIFFTGWQAWELRKTNNQMRETHDVERRPLLSVEIELSRFKTCKLGHRDARVILTNIVVHNQGMSPAMNVILDARITAFRVPDHTPEALTDKLMSAYRDCEDKTPKVIFPSKDESFPRSLYLLESDINATDHPTREVAPIIYGVARYTSTHIHGNGITGFAFVIGKDGVDLFSKDDDWTAHDATKLPSGYARVE